MLLITYRDAHLFGLLPEQMVALCGGVFILPFFLFSTTSGQLPDKYPKHTLTRFVKLLEIAIMGLAGVGFLLENLPLLLGTLGAFGTTAFGFDRFLIGHPDASTAQPKALQSIPRFLLGPSGWRIPEETRPDSPREGGRAGCL